MIKHRKPRGPMSPEQKEKIRQGHQKRREMMTTAKHASDQLRAGMIESAMKSKGQGPPYVTKGIANLIETDFGPITPDPHPFLEEQPPIDPSKLSTAELEAMLNESEPPANEKPAEKVFPVHRCMNCGWIGRELTFAEAIEQHRKDRHPCKPSLTQPSEKYLTEQLLAKANRNPHRVAQILARQNGSL